MQTSVKRRDAKKIHLFVGYTKYAVTALKSILVFLAGRREVYCSSPNNHLSRYQYLSFRINLNVKQFRVEFNIYPVRLDFIVVWLQQCLTKTGINPSLSQGRQNKVPKFDNIVMLVWISLLVF